MAGKRPYRRRRCVLHNEIFVLLTGLLIGCRTFGGSSTGVSLSVTVPALSYLQSPMGGKNADFPTLAIFDRNGEMVWISHDGNANAAMPKSLPGSLAGLKTISGKPALSQITEKLLGLKERDREELVPSRMPTIVSIFLDGCHACTVQEEALGEDTKKALVSHGVNSLLIHVSMP